LFMKKGELKLHVMLLKIKEFELIKTIDLVEEIKMIIDS
jgi:hypothetical protein